MQPEIYSVSAKGDLGCHLDLTLIVRELKDAEYNEGFKGGRVDLDVYTEDDIKLARIQIFHTGKYIITGCKSIDQIELAFDALIQLLNNISQLLK